MCRWLVAGLALSAAYAGPQGFARSLTVSITWRAASEDDAAPLGRVDVRIADREPAVAVVWEAACALDGRRDSSEPPASTDPDQSWSFELRQDADERGRPIARLRYVHVAPAGRRAGEPRVLRPGQPGLHLNEISARRACGYDRIVITVEAVRDDSPLR